MSSNEESSPFATNEFKGEPNAEMMQEKLSGIEPNPIKKVYRSIPGLKRRFTAKFKLSERLIKKAKDILNYNSYTEPYFALVKAVRQSLIKYTSSLKDSKDEVKEMLHISPMLSATNALYNKNYKEMIEWLETKNLEKIYLEMESLVHQSNEVIKVFETNIEDGHSPTSTDGKDSPAATEVQKIDMLIDNPEESKNSFSDYEEDEDDYIPNVSKNYIALSVNPTASPTAANALAVNPMASPPASNEVISNHCPPHLSVTNDQYRGSEMITSSQQPMVELPGSNETSAPRQHHLMETSILRPNAETKFSNQYSLAQLVQHQAEQIRRMEHEQHENMRVQNQLLLDLSSQLAKLNSGSFDQNREKATKELTLNASPPQQASPQQPATRRSEQITGISFQSYDYNTGRPTYMNSSPNGSDLFGYQSTHFPTGQSKSTHMPNQSVFRNGARPPVSAAQVHGLIASLPKFDGNKDEYKLFKTMFMNVVHNTDLDPTVKQSILLQSLTGSARICITSTEISAEDYFNLLEELDTLYNNSTDRLDRNEFLYKSLPFHQTNYSEMEKDLLRHVAAVNALKREGVAINCKTFIQIMVDKLPYELMRSANKLIKRIRQYAEQGGPQLTFMAVYKSIQDNIQELASEQQLELCKRNRTTANEIMTVSNSCCHQKKNVHQSVKEVLSCSKDNTTSLAYKTNFPTTSTEVAGAPSKQMGSQSPTPAPIRICAQMTVATADLQQMALSDTFKSSPVMEIPSPPPSVKTIMGCLW